MSSVSKLLSQNLRPGRYVQLTISDTGAGISPEIQGQAIDLFSADQDVGKGYGLGLSMVNSYLRQCPGYMTIHSDPGKGTVVNLYFPLNPETSVDLADECTRIGDTSEQVLIVEDDVELRMHATSLLGQLGYQTFEATKPGHALQLLRTHSSIVLLFCNKILSGSMSAVELAEHAWLTHPELKVLFTSGYTGDITRSWGIPGYELLEKPYTNSQLAHVLSQKLGHAIHSTTI